MAKIISIANQKGGVGKTTTTGSLAAVFKKKGYRVLAVDFDPQGNLSFFLGADKEISATIYHVLKGEVKTQFAIQRTGIVDVIAANILLSGIELEFTDRGREFLLRDALSVVQDLYDYILIDPPPGLGILTINAFTASDFIVIPMLSDIYSLQGLTQLYETVEHIRHSFNEKLTIAGMLLVRFNPRENMSAEIRGTVEMIAKSLNIPLLKTFIHTSVTIAQAQASQADITKFAPNNKAVLDYIALAEELIRKGV